MPAHPPPPALSISTPRQLTPVATAEVQGDHHPPTDDGTDLIERDGEGLESDKDDGLSDWEFYGTQLHRNTSTSTYASTAKEGITKLSSHGSLARRSMASELSTNLPPSDVGASTPWATNCDRSKFTLSTPKGRAHHAHPSQCSTSAIEISLTPCTPAFAHQRRADTWYPPVPEPSSPTSRPRVPTKSRTPQRLKSLIADPEPFLQVMADTPFCRRLNQVIGPPGGKKEKFLVLHGSLRRCYCSSSSWSVRPWTVRSTGPLQYHPLLIFTHPGQQHHHLPPIVRLQPHHRLSFHHPSRLG